MTIPRADLATLDTAQPVRSTARALSLDARARSANAHDGVGRLAAASFAAALLAAILCAGAGTLRAQSGGFDPILRYGLSVTTVADVNPSDALAASLLYARSIGEAVGAWKDVRAFLFEDSTSLVNALNASTVDLVAMSTMEFLSIERTVKADPLLLYVMQGEVEVEYVLLARDSVRSIADLAGRRVAIYNPSNRRDLGDTWLDTLLLEAGLPDAGRAAPQVRMMRKRSQAAMALFFNQVDAAVETRSAFETAVELNPQVGQHLRVLARSPRLLPGLVCVRRSMDAGLKRRYVEKAVTMHQLPQHRQTFVVLHINRLVAFEPRFLESTRELAERYQALRRARPDGPRPGR